MSRTPYEERKAPRPDARLRGGLNSGGPPAVSLFVLWANQGQADLHEAAPDFCQGSAGLDFHRKCNHAIHHSFVPRLRAFGLFRPTDRFPANSDLPRCDPGLHAALFEASNVEAKQDRIMGSAQTEAQFAS